MDRKAEERQPQDELRMCADCGKRFTWTVGEQRFYSSKLLSPPRRCPACRERRRVTINPDPGGRR